MLVNDSYQRQADLAMGAHAEAASANDFDFLFGAWDVHHKRLSSRLQNSADWQTFSGRCNASKILGGQGNFDEHFIDLPGDSYRAATLRCFDPQSKRWAIWWLDSRNPLRLEQPLIGQFYAGIGTFFGDEIFDGRPIRVRFIWSECSPMHARWQQAFSEDGGSTWETNWMMEFRRAQIASSI